MATKHNGDTKMKSILVAVAITLIAASSALAAPRHANTVNRANANAMIVDVESNDVYVAGKLIGRDPDPSIRQSLRDNYYSNSGH